MPYDRVRVVEAMGPTDTCSYGGAAEDALQRLQAYYERRVYRLCLLSGCLCGALGILIGWLLLP